MDTNDYYEQLEPRVGRRYKNWGLLRQAMTAPATETDNYEGHRSFAQTGEWLLQFILGHRCLQMGSTRANINDLIRDISARDHRASVAISMGLVPFIKCSPRQKEGPSKGTLSSTISAIVYATWSDSGGDWVETVKVMRHMGIYPTNRIDPETRPNSEEELTSSSNIINLESLSAASERRYADASIAAFMDCITPSDLALTSAGEKENIVNTGDPEVPDQYGLSASGSPRAERDSPLMMIETPEFCSTPSLDSQIWISAAKFGIHADTEGSKQASDDLHRFDPSDKDEVSPSTQGLRFLTTGTVEFQDCDDREGTPETSSTRSTVTADNQRALIRREARLNESSLANGITTTNDEEQSTTSDTPNRNRDSLPQLDCNIVTTTKARSAATTSRNTRRQKTSSRRGPTGSPSSLYIAHERGKVLDRNLHCPEDYFTTRKGQTRMTELELEEYADILEVVNFTLGGCETFVVLGDVLRAYRQNAQTQFVDMVQDLSLSKRLQVIHEINGKAAYHILLKNLHILYFTREAASKFPNKSRGFIEVSRDSLEPQSKRPRGNPLHVAQAAITKNIIKDIYPDLDEGNAVYNRLYSEVKGLRKYGQRLAKLVEAFGFGILGFIPLVPSISTADQAFETTYKALFTTADKFFNNLLALTDECQGDFLRMLARAAQPLIESIIHQETDVLADVGIGNAAREDIMRYPKGAPELVKLLSRTSDLCPEETVI